MYNKKYMKINIYLANSQERRKVLLCKGIKNGISETAAIQQNVGLEKGNNFYLIFSKENKIMAKIPRNFKVKTRKVEEIQTGE